MKTIAERIREGMKIRNMKQVDIIERTGINKGALSSYLSGKYEPKQNNIYLIAKALNVNEAWLMGHDVPMERNNIAELNKKDKMEIDEYLNKLENELLSQTGLMFDGEPMTQESKEKLIAAMRIGAEIAKKEAKEKYTPKKFRN